MRQMAATSLTRPADTRGYDKADDWRVQAACVDVDPEIFFPNPADRAGIQAAKVICASCPVRAICREEALENRESDGVWGGLDEDQRRRLIRTRNVGRVSR